MAFFGPEIQISLGVGKSFGTQMTEQPKKTVVGQIWLFLGHKSIFWGAGVKLLVPSYQEMRQFFRVENNNQNGSIWPLGTKIYNFDTKIGIFGAKSQFFVLESRFLSIEHINSTPRATHFLFGPTRKNSLFGYGSFFGAYPGFWPFQA